MFFKWVAFLDFGYNMFDFSELNFRSIVLDPVFFVKFGSLITMNIMVYLIYYKDKTNLDQFSEDDFPASERADLKVSAKE